MSRSIDAARRFADVAQAAVGDVLGQHRDDLVVRLVAVDHPEPADGHRARQEVSVRERLLRQDADVDRIAVALDSLPARALHAPRGDLLRAVGLRDEAVQRGAEARDTSAADRSSGDRSACSARTSPRRSERSRRRPSPARATSCPPTRHATGAPETAAPRAQSVGYPSPSSFSSSSFQLVLGQELPGGEQEDFLDPLGVRQQHQDPIQPDRHAARRRHAPHRLHEALVDRIHDPVRLAAEHLLVLEPAPLLRRIHQLRIPVRQLESIRIQLEPLGHRGILGAHPRQCGHRDRVLDQEGRAVVSELRLHLLQEDPEEHVVERVRLPEVDPEGLRRLLQRPGVRALPQIDARLPQQRVAHA